MHIKFFQNYCIISRVSTSDWDSLPLIETIISLDFIQHLPELLLATLQLNRWSYLKSFLPHFTFLTKFAHSSAPRAHENIFVLPSFRNFSKGNAFFNVRPRRGTSLPGIVQRTAAASRSHSRRGSNGQRRADISAGGSCWDAAIMFVH